MTEIENMTKNELTKFMTGLINEITELLLKSQPGKRFIKSREARELLNCSNSTLLNYRATGILHPNKIGGTFYYDLQEIKNLLQ